MEEIFKIRNYCPALREVLIPEREKSNFAEHAAKDNEALHKSILLLAHKRKLIHKITSPVHRYLMSGKKIRSDISPAYRKVFSEKWFIKSSALERHQKSRIYMGKLVELQYAELLEKQGLQIVNLEAWGGKFDIEAKHNNGTSYSFEVKYIGVEDNDFKDIVNSINSKPIGSSPSPYNAANYLMIRVFEAAKQLQDAQNKKIAVIVFDELTWGNFDFLLNNNFINWDDVKLINNSDTQSNEKWNQLLKQKKFQSIKTEIAPTINSLDEIRIYTVNNYEYELRKKI